MSSSFFYNPPQIKKEPVDDDNDTRIEPQGNDTVPMPEFNEDGDRFLDSHMQFSDDVYDDDEHVDEDVKPALMAPPPPRLAVSASSSTSSQTRQTSNTTVSSLPLASFNEATVRNVTLTPMSPSKPSLVKASDALPHESGVYNLDTYYETPQTSNQSSESRQMHDLQNTPDVFCNYVVYRHNPGGPPIRSTDSGGYPNAFLTLYLSAPPHRVMPASASNAARLRLNAIGIDWYQFLDLCATPRPNEPPCSAKLKCKAITNVCNKFGQRINNTPWVAMWYASERAKMTGPDQQTFFAQWSQRRCIICDIDYAARLMVWSTSTNTGCNPNLAPKAAIEWFVLINRGGEFVQSETFGPDVASFNGLVGNVPRPQINGWSIRETTQTSRITFNPPYTRAPTPSSAATADATRGF